MPLHLDKLPMVGKGCLTFRFELHASILDHSSRPAKIIKYLPGNHE